MQLTIARWLVDYDPDVSRRIFAQLPVESTGCDCLYCRNFYAAAGRAFPTEFQDLAHTLGLDIAKPSELMHWYRAPTGLYWTGGWFHFVGSIVSGADALNWSGQTGTLSLEQLVPGFEFGLTNHLVLVPPAFQSHLVVQLEFQTWVPWMLSEPEPKG